MNKIKIGSILSGFSILLGLFVMHGAVVLAAAPPGCYVSSTTGVSKVDCPSSVNADPSKCYVSRASDSASTPFAEAVCSGVTVGSTPTTQTTPTTSQGTAADSLGQVETGDTDGQYICGRGPNAPDDTSNEVKVAFDFGCVGGDPKKFTGKALNPIVDIAFALFRFLSAGVGLVVIGTIVVAGIQYSASRGDPQATGAAIHRVTNGLIALLIYIFMFALINFIIPGGMFL